MPDLQSGQIWRPADGSPERRIVRVDPAPTGMLHSKPAVWFIQGGGIDRPLPEPQFQNWIRFRQARLVCLAAVDPDPMPPDPEWD